MTIRLPFFRYFLQQRTNSKQSAQSAIHFLPEINLNINFKAQNRQTKTDTNPIPDPNRYRRRCRDPIARIQKFYTFIGTPEKSLYRVTIRNDSPGLVGQGGPNRRSKSMIKLFAK